MNEFNDVLSKDDDPVRTAVNSLINAVDNTSLSSTSVLSKESRNGSIELRETTALAQHNSLNDDASNEWRLISIEDTLKSPKVYHNSTFPADLRDVPVDIPDKKIEEGDGSMDIPDKKIELNQRSDSPAEDIQPPPPEPINVQPHPDIASRDEGIGLTSPSTSLPKPLKRGKFLDDDASDILDVPNALLGKWPEPVFDSSINMKAELVSNRLLGEKKRSSRLNSVASWRFSPSNSPAISRNPMSARPPKMSSIEENSFSKTPRSTSQKGGHNKARSVIPSNNHTELTKTMERNGRTPPIKDAFSFLDAKKKDQSRIEKLEENELEVDLKERKKTKKKKVLNENGLAQNTPSRRNLRDRKNEFVEETDEIDLMPNESQSTTHKGDNANRMKSEKEKEEKNIRVLRPRIRNANSAPCLKTIVKAKQRMNEQPVLKFTKSGENKEEDFIEDDKFESTRVNPNEEYSEKFYVVMKKNLLKTMDKDEAETIVNVHKKMHSKRLTLENRTKKINFGGRYEMDPWYDGTYPEDIMKCETIFVCDGCFMYFANAYLWRRHAEKCTSIYSPPGDEVYRDPNSSAGCISVFRLNGQKHFEYCKLLSQFAMLFLADKCLFTEIRGIDYFVVTEFVEESHGFRPVGYFSKQNLSIIKFNLCCFCVFPCYQKKGLGRFIIDFSYHLSILSKMPAGPERPLSPFGLVSYTSYWKRSVVLALAKAGGEIDMDALEMELGMRKEDIIEVIQNLFSTQLKKNELVINERLLKEIAAVEEEKDKGKVYVKDDCFEPEFVKYTRNFKLMMEMDDYRIACGRDPRN